MKSTKTCALAVAALAAISTWASASPMYFQFNGVPVNEIVTLNDPTLGINNVQVYAGQSAATLSAFSDFSFPTNYYTFCVDLAHSVTNGQDYLVNLRSTNDGLNRGEQIAYLYNTYGTAQITNSDVAAALQLAIWDELANNGQGQFSMGATLTYSIPNGTVATLLANYLAAANASTGALAAWLDSNVMIPEPPGFVQGQGFLAPPGSNPNVPEPASIALLAIGAVGVALFVRRRKFAR